MTACSPSCTNIKLTLLFSVSVGEGWAASHSACKYVPPCMVHLPHLSRACPSFYAKKTHSTAHSDFVAAPGKLKSP